MSNKIKIEIHPLPHYEKLESEDYILCGIDFYFDCNGNEHHYRSETSNICIQELLTEINDYLSNKLTIGTELYYGIPWMAGNYGVYPYSFKVKDDTTWSFRYKKNQNDGEYDFECDIKKDDVVSMMKQLKEEFSKIDWDSLGKTPLYTFDFSDKDFEWCYHAKEFSDSLNKLCTGKSIKKMFVSALNYSDPLRVKENFVNYFCGSELIILFDDFIIDLLIYAQGLFKWRVFDKSEFVINGPAIKFIEDSHKEYCELGNVYTAFTVDYTDTKIKNITIEETEYWPWTPKSFDKTKLGTPVELPDVVNFHLKNGYILSLMGWDDDFCIKLLPE